MTKDGASRLCQGAVVDGEKQDSRSSKGRHKERQRKMERHIAYCRNADQGAGKRYKRRHNPRP